MGNVFRFIHVDPVVVVVGRKVCLILVITFDKRNVLMSSGYVEVRKPKTIIGRNKCLGFNNPSEDVPIFAVHWKHLVMLGDNQLLLLSSLVWSPAFCAPDIQLKMSLHVLIC